MSLAGALLGAFAATGVRAIRHLAWYVTYQVAPDRHAHPVDPPRDGIDFLDS